MSKPLKFTVGTNCEETFIHGDVLKSRSTPWFNANLGKFAGDESLIIKDADNAGNNVILPPTSPTIIECQFSKSRPSPPRLPVPKGLTRDASGT